MLKLLDFLKFKKIDNYQDIDKLSNFKYNYLLGLAMLYMMFTIVAGLTVYKFIQISIFIIPANILITPFIYSISNITTEVYGFPIARNMMWWFIFVSGVFTITSTLIVHIPSENADYQHTYELIFGSMPLIFVAGILGSICGLYFNNYFVSKYKVIMKGKKYWLRSIISTAGGEIIYILVAYPIMYVIRLSFHELLYLMLSVSFFKVMVTALIWPLECFFAAFLKRKERLDTWDDLTDYKLFMFRVKSYISSEGASLKIIK